MSTTVARPELGTGCHAWVQTAGGWGRSNAGLVVGDGASLLVDTLFDVPLTRRMLADLAPLTAAAPIATVVNTHGNGDHWFGNQLLAGTEIVAASASLADMRAVGPREVVALRGMPTAAGAFVRSAFGPFDIAGVTPTYPTRTYDGVLELCVGGLDVVLTDVGPAHTSGDTIVHVPDAGTVFVGDIVFSGGTPVVWNGPVGNWIAAGRRLLDLGVHTIVPGHGPVAGPEVVHDLVDYLEFVAEHATARFGAGMPFDVAAADIDLGRYAWLPERERLAVNVHAVYRELDPALPPLDGPALFGCMAALDQALHDPAPSEES